jgi:aminoglycoside phosphotransferase (APT) family kinase protein
MEQAAVRTPSTRDPFHIEARMRHILDRKQVRAKLGPYAAKRTEEVDAALQRFFAAEGLKGVRISKLARLAGGASKEQFAFTLQHDGAAEPERLVLRMDPLEGIVETCRLRESQILRAMASIVPVPEIRFVDPGGEHLGQPGLISRFVPGVTKPTQVRSTSVSGIGSSFGEWVDKLAPQFLDNLVAIHNFDFRRAEGLSAFEIPAAGTREAPLWQVNLFSRIRREDLVEPVPLLSYTECWLREHAPICDDPCVVHADYRIGNFMFEEPSGKFTAVLDWELAHIGDFHADIAWVIQALFGTWSADGCFLVSGLLPRDEFLRKYQEKSGRTIDPAKLGYYEILNAWKCAVMDLCTAIMAGKNKNNHQDLLVTWLASAGAVFLEQIVGMIRSAGE